MEKQVLRLNYRVVAEWKQVRTCRLDCLEAGLLVHKRNESDKRIIANTES